MSKGLSRTPYALDSGYGHSSINISAMGGSGIAWFASAVCLPPSSVHNHSDNTNYIHAESQTQGLELFLP